LRRAAKGVNHIRPLQLPAIVHNFCFLSSLSDRHTAPVPAHDHRDIFEAAVPARRCGAHGQQALGDDMKTRVRVAVQLAVADGMQALIRLWLGRWSIRTEEALQLLRRSGAERGVLARELLQRLFPPLQDGLATELHRAGAPLQWRPKRIQKDGKSDVAVYRALEPR